MAGEQRSGNTTCRSGVPCGQKWSPEVTHQHSHCHKSSLSSKGSSTSIEVQRFGPIRAKQSFLLIWRVVQSSQKESSVAETHHPDRQEGRLSLEDSKVSGPIMKRISMKTEGYIYLSLDMKGYSKRYNAWIYARISRVDNNIR